MDKRTLVKNGETCETTQRQNLLIPVRKRSALSNLDDDYLAPNGYHPRSHSFSKVSTFDKSFVRDHDNDEVFKEGNKENTFLSPNVTDGGKPLYHSPTFLTPRKFSAPEFIESPLRRKLESVGVENYHQDLIKLGQGTFGTVILGLWRGTKVAVKVLANKERLKCKHRRKNSIESEMNLMKLDHKHIVKVFASFSALDETDHSLVIMEYIGIHSLQNIIEEKPDSLTNGFIHRVFCQISSALSHCHERNVIHLDVKPANVLVSSRGVCKLADFGCSNDSGLTSLDRFKSAKPNKKFYLVGTPGFIAPELVQNTTPTPKCDVFSFGIFMWQVLSKERVPFPGIHMHTIIFKVVSQSYRPDESLTKHVPPFYCNLYRQCWSQKPVQRPTMNHVAKLLEGHQADFKNVAPKTKSASQLKLLR